MTPDPWVHAPGGAWGQNVGHLKVFFYNLMQTIYADSWSDIRQPYDIEDCHTMTYTSRSSDFALYFEDYLMDEHQTWIMGQCIITFEEYLMDDRHTFR